MKKLFFFLKVSLIFFCIFYFYKNSLNYFLKKKRVLNVLLWAGDIDSLIIKDFEEKTGIKLNASYFSTNEELISKISFTNGKGIDLIMPSEYTLHNLYNKKMLIPFEKNRLKNFDKFYKSMTKDGIINNILYAIPFEINFYGLAMKEELYDSFSDKNDLYHLFFNRSDSENSLKVCMTNDFSVSINLVKNYYENYFKNRIPDKEALFTIIYEILKKQRKNVVVYTDSRVSHLLMNDEVDIAFIQTHEYLRALQKVPNLKFKIFPFAPIKSTEYFAISKGAENIDEAYEFINYLTEPEIMARNYKFSYSPATLDISDYEEYPKDIKNLIEKAFKKIIRPIVVDEIFSESQKSKLMMLLKSE